MPEPEKKISKASSRTDDVRGEKSLAKTKLLIYALIVVAIFFTVIISLDFMHQMRKLVDESTVSNMHEIADHDIYLIRTYLDQNIENLESAGNMMRINKCDSVLEAQRLLNLERASSSFETMYLMDSEGRLYSDNFTIMPPDDNPYINMFKDGRESIVVRMNKYSTVGSAKAQMLVYGTKIRPYKVGDVTFTTILGANNINTIQDKLKINNFNGLGFASLIDQTGEYIINVESKTAVINTSNFFNELQEGKLQDISFEEIKESVKNKESLMFSWDTPEGVRMVSMLDPLPDVDWIFEMSVPESVFTDQSVTLVTMTAIVIIVIIVIMLLVLVLAMRWSRKTASAQASAQARSEFLSSLSHEIRTPLNGLVGLNRLMQSHIDEHDKMSEYLEKSEVTTQYLLSLLNDVLDMSKLESGKFDIEKRPMNVEVVVDRICTMQRETYNNRGVKLIVDLNVKFPWVFADELHLKQVIMNIMGNASKFTPNGGSVTVCVTQVQEQNELVTTSFAITDTGIGMTQEFLESIFDPFSQERTRSNESQKGTGLGMSISHMLMVLMGGRIDVTSELNVGSCFTVVLPAEVVPDDHPDIALQESINGDGIKIAEALNILLVEDNELNATIMSEILEEQGCIVDRAVDGLDAIEKFEQSDLDHYDVVVMDLQMPRMDGFDSAAGIRASKREDAGKIVIFACSADQAKEDKERAASVGMNGFISKPVDFDEMFRLLQSVKSESDKSESGKSESGSSKSDKS